MIYKFSNEVNRYYDLSTKNHRFLSWEHCYEYFYNNKNIVDYDKAALMLFSYLASWGMLRKSFLMDYDYKIHIDLIKILVSEYSDLWNSDKNSWNMVQQAAKKINDYYKKFHDDKEISETLQTKILLGIFGCTPAYDRYFKDGISKYNESENTKLIKNFGENSYIQLWNFYIKQKKIEKPLHNNPNIKYPPMKLVDMFFWQIGGKMIKILNKSEIEDIKEKLLQRVNKVYISKTTGHFITFIDYDVFNLFNNIEKAFLISSDKKQDKQRRTEILNELKIFDDYDTVISFINLENELKNFKYFDEKSRKDIDRGFKFLSHWAGLSNECVKNKDMLAVDVDDLPTSFMLFKYKK